MRQELLLTLGQMAIGSAIVGVSGWFYDGWHGAAVFLAVAWSIGLVLGGIALWSLSRR
jgi:hypothetical protein